MRVRIRHRPRPRAALALGAASALVVGLLASSASATTTPSDDDTKQPIETTAEREASAALDRAEDVATDDTVGRDATMALREVANTRAALEGAERRKADAILARPTDGRNDGGFLKYDRAEAPPVCTPALCVHYVASGPHASTPSYVRTAVATLSQVHNTFVGAGYRAPKADGGRGGNAKIDIYLGNVGPQGLYGYCTSDDPSKSTRRYDRWAYCVLDNDYSAAEFPTNTPLENLQVTAGHEYFHAIQYGYDRFEDPWLLEATAAWVEDELYDGVDDNLQYLRRSALTSPSTPLDTFSQKTGYHYGTWSFFRFLTERFQARKGALPRLVLDIFEKADGSPAGPDMYSWQAVDSVLRGKKTTAAKMLGAYAVANRRPGKSYGEGRANRYPTAPARRVTLGAGASRTVRARLDHLSTQTTRLTPRRLSHKKAKVRLAFDLSARPTGSSALITTTLRSGKVRTVRARLDRRGNGVAVVPFSTKRVQHVEVTMVNGSRRFQCWQGSLTYSCQGRSLDDNLRQQFTARALRR